jgi:hypothetical protein
VRVWGLPEVSSPPELDDERVIVALMVAFERFGIECGETWAITYDRAEKIGKILAAELRATEREL